MAKQKNKIWSGYLWIATVVVLALVIIANKAGWIGQGEVIRVATEPVTRQVVNELVSASGKIHPEVEVKLSSEVSGEIVELNVREGEVVEQGQVLCKIRPDILQSGYDRAVASLNAQRASLAAAEQQLIQQEANFANIEATYNRNLKLFEQKVISAAEFEKIKADYLSAEANLEAQRQNVLASRYAIDQSQAAVTEAGDNLSRATIYAPMDGVVSLLQVELGERVVGTAQMAGTEIMRIANMNSMEVNVEVNENDITRVALGNQATIEVDAYRGRQFRGEVTEIASSSTTAASSTVSVDQVTNFNVKVRILPESYADLLNADLPNPSPFRPGLSATVDIHTRKDEGLVVPIEAVTTREESDSLNTDGVRGRNRSRTVGEKRRDPNAAIKEYVFVYNEDVVDQVEVTTGIQDDVYIRVLSGLKEGQEVVVRPFNAISRELKDRSRVRRVDRKDL